MHTLQRVSIGTVAVALMLGQIVSADVVTTTSTFNGRTVVSFTGNGTTNWTVPNGVTSIDLLVVAGGGPGGQGGGGGGGAGGLLYYQNQAVTPLSGQAVVVGAGGIGGTSANQVWTSGENSSCLGYTALGGGRGAIGPSGTPWDHHGYGNNPPPAAGSGGGADADRPTLVGPGTPGQGYAGGKGVSGSQYSGGGGGAGGVGGNSTGTIGGNGGSGLDFSGVFGPVGGDSGWFAGGGGGGVQYAGTGGSVGRGGGGAGAGGQTTPATAGTPGTGGGGGACGVNTGYDLTNGGSGIVVLSYTPSAGGWDYATWAGLYANNQTADQDFNNDGVPNGVAYFMGQTGSTFTAIPKVTNTNGVITWAWPRDPNATAAFKFQISDTLNGSDWEDVVPPNASINTSDPTRVIYTFGPTKRFCRLVVTP